MGVLVALAVVQLLHQLRRRVAKVQGDGFGGHGAHIALGGQAGAVQGVRLGRHRQVHDRVGQMHIALRHSQKMARLVGGDGDLQGLGIGHPDILAGKAHQPPGDVQRILAAVQHPREPVDRRVGVAVAHGFMEGGDEVVMLLAVLVVEQGAPVHALGQHGVGNVHGAVLIHMSVEHGHLQGVERRPSVSVGEAGDGLDLRLADFDLRVAQAFGALEGVVQQDHHVFGREGLQHEDLAAG